MEPNTIIPSERAFTEKDLALFFKVSPKQIHKLIALGLIQTISLSPPGARRVTRRITASEFERLKQSGITEKLNHHLEA